MLGGDFAQILPVIRQGARQLTVLASVRHSTIWNRLCMLTLRSSMRMITSETNQEVLSFLREIRDQSISLWQHATSPLNP